MTVLREADGWRVRLAVPEDNDALCAFVASVPMEGRLALAQERGPDFFAAARATLGTCETFVAEDVAGRVVGCGTYALREGRMPDGSTAGVGLISDLRVLPAWRGARVLPTLGRVALERARDAHGVEVFQAAVMDGNRRVVGTARARGNARAGQPVSRPMTPYHLASLPPGGRGDPRVERASAEDLDEVARFLDEGQRTRVLGERVTRKTLERRFDAWPGLRPESFLLVRDGSGGIAACGAPWDASPVRRYRVLRYGGALRLAARAMGLPPAGRLLRTATLSHLEVRGDDPRAFARLVAAARAEARGAHLLNVFVPRASPLQRGLPRLATRRTDMTLLVTTLPDARWRTDDLSTARPGFEMALA